MDCVAHQAPHQEIFWDFPGKNTGMGCQFLLQGILPIQELNLSLLYWQVASLLLSQEGSNLPKTTKLQIVESI